MAMHRRDAKNAEMDLNKMTQFPLSGAAVRYKSLVLSVLAVTKKTLRPQRLRGET